MAEQLKLPFCAIVVSLLLPLKFHLSQTGTPVVLRLQLEAADSWVFSLIRRELSEQCLALLPSCLLALFPVQTFP